MKSLSRIVTHSARAFAGAIGSFVLWTAWLALGVLLCFQLYILTAKELAIPDFALRQLETKLAESGLRASFKRTSFDPTGRILIDDARISLLAFPEPIITADAIYVQLNPLALILGGFEPSEIRVMGAVATIPGALSQSGRAEEIVRGLDATVEPRQRLLTIRQLNGRVANIEVSAHGTVPLPKPRDDKPATAAIAEFVRTRLPLLCRQASAAAEQLTQLEAPVLQLELAPSESGALGLSVTALARAIKLTRPLAVQATQIRATTRFLLFGERPPSHFEVSAEEVRLPDGAKAHRVHASVRGQFRPGSLQFDLRDIAVTADSVSAAGGMVEAVSAWLFPRVLPRLNATVTTRFLGERLALKAALDLDAKSGEVQFEGQLSPKVLDLISERVRVNVRNYYEFDALTVERAEAQFGPKWKFEKLTARVRIPRMNSYGVIMEDGRAAVELEPHRFYSPEAFARVGENFARGTYEHDLQTQQYRFLLDGQLRPMEIAPWFRAWWPNFFRQLDFVAGPPIASVDVRGMWRDGRQSSVFVFADAGKSVVRGAEFDRVRTRIFIRPTFYDALELRADRGNATAQGRFTLLAEATSHEWQSLDLALDSSLDLALAAQLLGPNGTKILAPFQVAAPPALKLRGSFAGPAAPAGAKDQFRIEARTKGEFRFHRFPLHDASFVVMLDGEDVVIDNLEAMFAGGVVGGHARVWGVGAQRRLGFDVALQDATLGQVAAQVQEFLAAQKGVPPPPPGKYVKEKANVRIDFAASAEGLYADPLSFRGDGNASLRGAEIGEVPLLGTLSELLKFTALRFTEARSNFKIEGSKLVFPQVELRGANSAIDAHGEYAIDRRMLDFNAKVFPFQESESIIKSVVGAVLTPLSNALEVKLTGTLEKPQWAFVMGPTNILRALGDNDAGAKPATPTTDKTAPEPSSTGNRP